MIDDHKTQVEWKIQLTMAINFISSKDSDGIHTMHAKSNNIEIMVGNKMDEIIGKIFDSFLQKYWEKFNEWKRVRFW